MQRADQLKVSNIANLEIIKIRDLEVQYFNKFFAITGLQAALMVGAMTGSISQCPAWAERTVDQPFLGRFVYFTATAATLSASMLCVMSCIFIGDFGAALALRGPSGSMVMAINGMIAEQKQVLSSFMLMLVFFCFAVVGMFFVIMDNGPAVFSTFIILAGFGTTYHYTLRIYNRFYFRGLKGIGWKTENEIWSSNERQSMDEPEMTNQPINGESAKNQGRQESNTKNGNGKSKKSGGKSGENTMMSSFLSCLPTIQETESEADASEDGRSTAGVSMTEMWHNSRNSRTVSKESRASHSSHTTRPSKDSFDKRFSNRESVLSDVSVANSVFKDSASGVSVSAPQWMLNYDPAHHVIVDEAAGNDSSTKGKGGYLTIKSNTGSGSYFRGKERWQRMYFVIKATERSTSAAALVYYYKDKNSFQTLPKKPINKRGIDLEGYQITMPSQAENRHVSDTASVSSFSSGSGSKSKGMPCFEFCLVPENSEDVRKVWEFRCDTELEMKKWIFLFAKAIESCNDYSSDVHDD